MELHAHEEIWYRTDILTTASFICGQSLHFIDDVPSKSENEIQWNTLNLQFLGAQTSAGCILTVQSGIWTEFRGRFISW